MPTKEDLEYNGCGDHSCIINPPQGVGTNGGCRCFKDLSPYIDALRVRMAVTRKLHQLRNRIKELELEAARLNGENAALSMLRPKDDEYICRDVECPDCKGTGMTDGHPGDCSGFCRGTGKVPARVYE